MFVNIKHKLLIYYKIKGGCCLLLSLFFIIVIIAISCKTAYRISYQNYAQSYKPKKESINPEYILFNANTDTTVLYSKIATNELLLTRPEGKTSFYAKYKLKIEVFSSFQSNTIIDSITLIYNDSVVNKEFIFSSVKLRIKAPGNFPVRLTFTDLNRELTDVKIVNLNKINGVSQNDFLITDLNGLPFFANFIDEYKQFKIRCRDASLKSLFVRYYNRSFDIAQLPFVSSKEKPFNFEPDSSFFVNISEGLSDVLSLKEEGIYHFQSNANLKEGLTIFRFHKDFPHITQPEQMVYPLRYLTSKNEYDKIIIQKDKKTAVDEFWLETAGNKTRGRELIKKFYNRVQDANVYFTSYMEGWKTDRGLIYIIYGNPNIVYRNEYAETWIYGEEFNSMSVTLVFNKRENPFTDNDYILTRSPIFKDTWYNAVDVWRR